MTHLINKLQFQVHCSGEEQAFYLRHSFPDTIQEQIIRVVDELCSDYVPEDEMIQIDKIEIDAGSFSTQSLYHDFDFVFRQKFEEELKKRISVMPSAKRKSSRQSSRAELFFYFLETGTIPWWAIETSVDLDEISKDLFAHCPEAVRDFFYRNRFNQEVWKRVVYQLNNHAKAHIILIFEKLSDAKEQFEKWMDLIGQEINAPFRASGMQRESMINDIILKYGPFIFATTADNKIKSFRRLFMDHIEQVFNPDIVSTTKITDILLKIPEAQFPGDLAGTKEINLPVSAEEAKTESKKEHQVKYTVREAGIILLAPFLERLFSKLGLYNKTGWESKEAAWKAVHLLKFMATGQQQIPEYTLLLEKLLCGLPLHEPIPLEIFLTEEELTEGSLLLQSVLEHWQALRSTSVTGLRETFFKRDGLLAQKENNWVLQVERKTLDVLLDSLPWGYSIIRLPWNDFIINVEW